MSSADYPWRWLSQCVGTTFLTRFPWMDAIAQAGLGAEAVCVLLPEAAGGLHSWGDRLGELLGHTCSPTPGGAAQVAQTLADLHQIDCPFNGSYAEWNRIFLAECRRRMPHVQPLPLLVVDAEDAAATSLADLVQAQRALGYRLVRPVLLRRTAPEDWDGECVRFGLPELVGDLHRIAPPASDLTFWTDLVLAMAVVWEAGACPALADDLWEALRLGRAPTLRDAGFDDWLQIQFDEFARKNLKAPAPPLPRAVAFGPLAKADADDCFWQQGVLCWQDGRFDLVPLYARLWADGLDRDACEALRRRRLTNAPLARWLSAWAASIEESLRVAALQVSSDALRRFLKQQPPRRGGTGPRSRWEELGVADEIDAVDWADFSDLVGFVASQRPAGGRHGSLTVLLDQCRQARNRVVHQRRLSAADLLRIVQTVDWLAESGLL